MENAQAESLTGKLRDEFIGGKWFPSPADAWEIIEGWRKDYNSARPHNSLRGLTPHQYAETTSGLHLALVAAG
jgi:putative transposase